MTQSELIASAFNPPPELLRGVDNAERRAEEAEHAIVAERAARRVAEISAERFHFLSEASALLTASLDEESVVGNLSHLGVAVLADWCAVYLVDSGGRVRLASVASEPPAESDSECDAMARSHADLVARVHDGGRSILEERHGGPLTTAGSRLGVPLIAQGRCLGALVIVADAPPDRLRASAGVVLAEELARHAASALANARLYAELAESRSQVTTILESISDAFFAVDRDWRST